MSSLSEEDFWQQSKPYNYTYVHNCLVEDGSFDITLVKNILEKYIPGMTPMVEQELQDIRKQSEILTLKFLTTYSY